MSELYSLLDKVIQILDCHGYLGFVITCQEMKIEGETDKKWQYWDHHVRY